MAKATILGRNAVDARIHLGMVNPRQSLSMLFLLLPALGACSPLVEIAKEQDTSVGGGGGSGDATSGSSATGGTGTGAAATCSGDMVGTWTVAGSSLGVSGQLDLTMLGLGCASAPITGGSLQVTGTFTSNPDGTFSDNTTTTGSEQFTLAPSCMEISGTQVICSQIGRAFQAIGYASATCTSATGGGCDCTAAVQQNGAMGTLSEYLFTNGTYSTSGNVVSTSDGASSAQYSYCVSGDTLSMTPQTTSPTTTGTIVLKRPTSACPNATPCGGDPVGTWNVTSTCLGAGGQLDLTPIGLGCTSAPITGAAFQVTGTLVINSDGTFSDNTTTTGSEQFTLAASCMRITGTQIGCDQMGGAFEGVGYASATCTAAAGGGCQCTASVDRAGGIGVVSPNASKSGVYTLAGTSLTTSAGTATTQYSYCASGNSLTLNPQTTTPLTASAIVLQKQ